MTVMREPTYYTLAALLDGPLHGYAIIKRAAELSGGRVRLAAGDKAYDVCERPAWLTGISHYVDQMSMGTRDLTRSPSAERAAAAVDTTGVEVAELHAPFSHQELILRRELGLGDDVRINPSGGALASNPMFSAGGIRVGEAAKKVWAGEATKVLGHATSGPALQQNLVCTMVSTLEGAS